MHLVSRCISNSKIPLPKSIFLHFVGISDFLSENFLQSECKMDTHTELISILIRQYSTTCRLWSLHVAKSKWRQIRQTRSRYHPFCRPWDQGWVRSRKSRFESNRNRILWSRYDLDYIVVIFSSYKIGRNWPNYDQNRNYFDQILKFYHFHDHKTV